MGTILHANAKTTIRIRKEIQESKESVLKLAKKYNLNPLYRNENIEKI